MERTLAQTQLLLMLLVVTSWMSLQLVTATAGDTEYCQWETFKANCKQPDEVIVMQRAKYGRMQYGRCIKRNYGYVGCDVDVLSFADMRCSGKRTCAVDVPNKYLDNTKPCPEDLKMYLEAEYTCINVTRPQHAKCEDREPVEVKGTTGILSSAITKDTGCGSTTTPWVIRAEPGQRISFRLTDFGLLGRNETGGSRQMHQHCQVYAIIKDGHTGQGTTICGGDPSQPKERHVYMSKGNYVEVRIIVGRNKDASDFLLKFEAMGCSDLQVPANSWTKRQGTEVEVGCEGSKESWKMTCKNGTWVGDMAPCVDTAATGSGANPDKQKRAARFTHVSSIIIIIGIAVSIALAILFVGLCIFRHKLSQTQSMSRTPQHHQKVGKLDPNLAVTPHNNNPDYRSNPPFFSRQDMYAAEDNEYAYVEEFQFNSPPTCTCPREGAPVTDSASSPPPCSAGGCDPYGLQTSGNTRSDKQSGSERHYEKSRPRVFTTEGLPQYFVLDPDLPSSTNVKSCDATEKARDDLMV